MNLRDVTTFEKVEDVIQIPIPQDREILIPKALSGYKEDQVFASADLPKEVSAQFIGLVKDGKGGGHLTYVVEPISKALRICGENGFYYGSGILHMVCKKLLLQEGIITARSIKRADLKKFNFKHEKYEKYWVASDKTEVYDNSCEYNLCRVRNRRCYSIRLFNSQSCDRTRDGAIRAIIVLKTKVINVDKRSDINWIEL